MRFLLPIIFLILGTGLGTGAGLFLREDQPSVPESDEMPEAPVPDEAVRPELAEGEPVQPGSADSLEYVRLSNQFVVPVVRDGRVRHLVVMSLTLEVDIGRAEAVFDREPRLRDALLRAMFSHANAGGFEGAFTRPSALDPLRAALRDAAHDVLGPSVHDVLIVSIVREDSPGQ